jgi:3' terminal RNA ribose 2'-O-methyltransferase Hen1
VAKDRLRAFCHGKRWLAQHPAKEEIARRYLKFQPNLFRQALARLFEEEQPEVEVRAIDQAEVVIEQTLSLNEQRLGAVMAAIRSCGARRVLDLGCGEGRLLRELLKDQQFEEIVGMDVSIRSLENARDRLKLDRMADQQASRIKLVHGSLIYRDRRLEGFDAAAVVEVVEHLDPPRLSTFERTIFEFARPRTVVLTTPNRDYNVTWENVGPERVRHPDHRFEWTRQEFRGWAEGIAGRFGYSVKLVPIGPNDPELGPPTQMGLFERR